jgi:hypothetical protein
MSDFHIKIYGESLDTKNNEQNVGENFCNKFNCKTSSEVKSFNQEKFVLFESFKEKKLNLNFMIKT